MSYNGNNIEEFKSRNGYVIDGAWYPRVTAICDIKAKPALYRFYANLNNFAQGSRIKELSATEGTKVHETIEALLKGENVEVTPDVAPTVEAFRRFEREHEFLTHPAMIEQRLMHPNERYAGTIDILAKVDGKVGVLDIKTSSGIWREYNLQTAAYLYAIQAGGLIGVPLRELPETRWILRLDQFQICQLCGARMRKKGGQAKIRGGFTHCEHKWGAPEGEHEFKELEMPENDFKAFLGAKALWEWENEEVLAGIGYA
jgi:hypothetical protein